MGAGGSAEGGAAPAPANGGVSLGELVTAMTPEQMRLAIYEMGGALDLHVSWTNFAGFLSKRETGTLLVLMEWIGFYREMPRQAFERIDNLPGLLRSHLNRGERAPLTGAQKQFLADWALEALADAEGQGAE